MNIVHLLLPLAILLGGSFALFFITAVWRGQFDDLKTPAFRVLLDEEDQTSLDTKSNDVSEQTILKGKRI